jgi:hypothetical protein
MHKYDRGLMKRGEAARRLIGDGEDPFQMLLAAVWPDYDWSESALYARLTKCPRCGGDDSGCSECGNTGLITAARRKLLAMDGLAAAGFAEAEAADAT